MRFNVFGLKANLRNKKWLAKVQLLPAQGIIKCCSITPNKSDYITANVIEKSCARLRNFWSENCSRSILRFVTNIIAKRCIDQLDNRKPSFLGVTAFLIRYTRSKYILLRSSLTALRSDCTVHCVSHFPRGNRSSWLRAIEQDRCLRFYSRVETETGVYANSSRIYVKKTWRDTVSDQKTL